MLDVNNPDTRRHFYWQPNVGQCCSRFIPQDSTSFLQHLTSGLVFWIVMLRCRVSLKNERGQPYSIQITRQPMCTRCSDRTCYSTLSRYQERLTFRKINSRKIKKSVHVMIITRTTNWKEAVGWKEARCQPVRIHRSHRVFIKFLWLNIHITVRCFLGMNFWANGITVVVRHLRPCWCFG